MAVFRVGGIDALLDIISIVIAAVAVLISPSSTMVYYLYTINGNSYAVPSVSKPLASLQL